MIIRITDIILSFFGLIILFPLFCLLIILGFCDTGSPIFYQKRMGRNQKTFTLIKFRSMKILTPSIQTDLVDNSSITSYGNLLRKSKVDELPQLWNVLIGKMSIVGPRPNLLNQKEVIFERLKLNLYDYRPGITGLAQIKGINMSEPSVLAKVDAVMMRQLNIGNYFKYIILTLTGKSWF